ncbi:hypothetical protein [Vibrio vulnificus]|uniref:hypothetical protein n=1 Tax=Vibrio vulnificus TaxID=672 RepID=UPI003EDB3F37
MFSKKAGDPLNLHSNLASYSSIKNRLSAFRGLFLKIDGIHIQEEQELSTILEDEYESPGAHEYAQSQLYAHEFYTQAHRISTLLGCYSLLENTMVHLCDSYADRQQLPIRVADLSGQGIARCRTYLEKYQLCDFSEPQMNKYWAELRFLNDLRNCLAHCGGDITKSRAKIKPKRINDTDGLHMRGNVVQLTSDFVVASIDTIDEFLGTIRNQ